MNKIQLKTSMSPKELYLTLKTEVEPTNLQTLLTGISDYDFFGDYDESSFRLRAHATFSNRNGFYIMCGEYTAYENGTIIDIEFGKGKASRIMSYVFYGIVVAFILFLLFEGLFNDVIYIVAAFVVGVVLSIMLALERASFNREFKRYLKLFKTLLK